MRTRRWRPTPFFPDPAVAQQLTPLFELLNASDICHLACVNSGWSAALDAWRSTETELPMLDPFYGWAWTISVGREDCLSRRRGDAWWFYHNISIRTVARKYKMLRSINCVQVDASDLIALAKGCTALRKIAAGGVKDYIPGPALIKLAQATQLRTIHIGLGLSGNSLVKLAQACPLLEDLRCRTPELTRDVPIMDAHLLAVADACPALRRLALETDHSKLKDGKGRGCTRISDDALLGFVSRCHQLERLEISRTIHPVTQVRLTQERPGLLMENQSEFTFYTVNEDDHEEPLGNHVTRPFSDLMNAYCRMFGGTLESLRFVNEDGNQISPDQTPYDMQMWDGDTIYVVKRLDEHL